VRVWETTTYQLCGQPMVQQGPIRSLAISPDSRRLVAATGTVAQLWRIPQPPNNLREMELRTWVALGARLSPQGVVESIPWQEWLGLRDELQHRRAVSAG
jgi:WD40 repeat protein